MNVNEMMRRDWDDRARRDAFHYIASWKRDWDINSFLASGESDYLTLGVGGADLACLASGWADFMFSYLVLQHVPTEELVFGYIREFLRVLRPGGAFLFQFNGSHKPTMNSRGRLAWGAVDALWAAGLVSVSRTAARLLGLDPAAAGKSWRGAAIEAARIVSVLCSNGGEIRELAGENTPMAWCCGVKKTGA